ncbi:helix-turn-helix transcriptional regulator [Mucilaginibacter sp. HC2]|uniref:helix-turn-helix domain-containing protein n=1 Tax=Mucilaginibacter inviolabilis TaxID=2714892 RepID=UPI00140D36D8|nr:AraC family transcriptional regulator [Mucilaginibacter inviolabilis]NHA07418.1 helix-turn-helix transcriptional regulator [Mucilaginibacter inviolabilis]
MLKENQLSQQSEIHYSCYYTRSRGGEQFIPEHAFSFQISGDLTLTDADKVYHSGPGDFRLSRRNQLVKFLKQPPPGGEFKSVSIFLDQQTLRNFSMEYGYKAQKQYEGDSIIILKPNPLYKSFIDSLQPYEHIQQPVDKNLLSVKLREAILILLQGNPELKDVLFDFSEPGKIDLEGFMNKNFHFNVQLKRFAYLTGRSLATFKRDFEKIFHITPSRWLQQKRLHEAHYQIKEQGKAPSDVYLELGFEDLSHFSYAFKKTFGVAPSRV